MWTPIFCSRYVDPSRVSVDLWESTWTILGTSVLGIPSYFIQTQEWFWRFVGDHRANSQKYFIILDAFKRFSFGRQNCCLNFSPWHASDCKLWFHFCLFLLFMLLLLLEMNVLVIYYMLQDSFIFAANFKFAASDEKWRISKIVQEKFSFQWLATLNSI